MRPAPGSAATDPPEPAVTIVVVAHAVRDELERCLGSIRRHAGMPVTTILVDNASSDDTRSWVREAHPEVIRAGALAGPGLVEDGGGLQRSGRGSPPRLLPLLRRPPLDRVFERRRT